MKISRYRTEYRVPSSIQEGTYTLLGRKNGKINAKLIEMVTYRRGRKQDWNTDMKKQDFLNVLCFIVLNLDHANVLHN